MFQLFLLAGICAVIARCVAHPTTRDLATILGFFLGPIGVIIAALLPGKPSAVPSASHASPELPPLPESFQIRRGWGTEVQIHGPYTMEEVLDYLRSGTLSPEDYYQTSSGQWAPLHTTGLCG